eukprot:TRINITY_DN63449_c0_g1_i1.p1 TRINITY_DN63449_c0_g1~~TRINITY_DN63449_c0_g1_i1.p1  ORF type:complete len:646 (-),score=28.47 TRINITY_DN63449_c0_g1_i1:19-1956(-)
MMIMRMIIALLICLSCYTYQQDRRNIISGVVISDQYGYADQPQIVELNKNGTWLCVLTTGGAKEGLDSENVFVKHSYDNGKTWNSRLIPVQPPHPYGPPAAWGNPVLTPSGRIWVYYTYNLNNITTLPHSKRWIRNDMVGRQVIRYSDDGGYTWSDFHVIPIPEKWIDRHNDFHGKHVEGWSVGKYITKEIRETEITGNGGSRKMVTRTFLQFAKRKCLFECHPYDPMQNFVVFSDNLMTEKDPTKLKWTTWPTGEMGYQTANCSLSEEGDVVLLPNGDLYFTLRSYDRFVGVAIIHNGTSYRDKLHAEYYYGSEYQKQNLIAMNQRYLKQPNGPLSPRRFNTEKYGVVYLLLYFNGIQGFEGRNPYWLIAGWPTQEGDNIRWSQPEVVLYFLEEKGRLGYPDLFYSYNTHEYYATETNKKVARLHIIDKELVHGLMNQRFSKTITQVGLILTYHNASQLPDGRFPYPAGIPSTSNGTGGYSWEFWVYIPPLGTSTAVKPLLMCDGIHRRSFFSVSLDETKYSLVVEIRNHTDVVKLQTQSGLGSHYGTWRHVGVMVDGDAHMVFLTLDGILVDGGAEFTQGFYFSPTKTIPNTHGLHSCHVPVEHNEFDNNYRVGLLRVYNRSLRVSEMVSNYQGVMVIHPERA